MLKQKGAGTAMEKEDIWVQLSAQLDLRPRTQRELKVEPS